MRGWETAVTSCAGRERLGQKDAVGKRREKIGNVEKQTHERVKSHYDIVSWHRYRAD